MEGDVDGFKNSMDSPKCDLVEVRVDEIKGSMFSPIPDFKEVKVEEVKQPSISLTGAKNENGSKGWEQSRVLMTFLLLINLYFIPLRLHEAYQTDGLLSRRFAYFALSGFMFLLAFIASFEMIGRGTFLVIMLPAMVGFFATIEWNLVVFISMAGVLVLYIVIFCSMVIYDKFFGKSCERKDIPPST